VYHPYLKIAEIYGVNNYNSLVLPPGDSYLAQMVFSKYLFPTNWEEKRKAFRTYYNKLKERIPPSRHLFSFDEYVEKTDIFFEYICQNIDWREHSLIGFTLNYGQFLPSIVLAKFIKEQDPEKKIVFGGSRTTGILGKRTLSTFDFVDYIVSGEGEEALYQLAKNQSDLESIPGLIYRKNKEILWNTHYKNININNGPLPNYDSFFSELRTSLPELQQFFNYYGRLPIEISRGCWWNRCTFCNLNLQYPQYKEKDVTRILHEIKLLSEKYHILSFQIIGNTLPKQHLRTLLQQIIALQKDLTFYAEARADSLKQEDYQLLKLAGFTTIQTGIESFSQNYLKKINKGTQIIHNIAALKYCKENKIKNHYNLIINYPNEEDIDYKETKDNIEKFKRYLDPPQLCTLRVVYGSSIQQHPTEYNIAQLEFTTIDKLMFPMEILKNNFLFIYDFTQKQQTQPHAWFDLIQNWHQVRTEVLTQSINTQQSLDDLIFYFIDGGTFLKIYDKCDPNNIQIYSLNETERAVFISCSDIISYHKLYNKLDLSETDLHQILSDLISSDILFEENNYFLSLPLSYSSYIGKPYGKHITDSLEINIEESQF
ncbi:MAG: RiPP maturation radical SAM C-methyltransferase, partial [Candidatus Thermoplasmatota archaeon]|nr:RiPP maturation radical SAM C-methyltransferase [Candidatus Thermoplasmatota archaeon]